MTSEELTQLIIDEIGGNWSLSNAHGVDLNTCLVPPVKQAYEDTFKENGTIDLWLVLEEDPGARSGYKIVFDEVGKEFGLAIPGPRKDVFLRYYGTFVETLQGM